MAIIKSYTDLSQSKKLAKILPITSIDFAWCIFSNGTKRLLRMDDWEVLEYAKSNMEIIPAWSLTALLNYLKSKNKFPDIKELGDGRFKLTTFIWDGKNSFQVFIADNLVDACYKLVLKLHECEML